jgi:outer membrane scaffolding protein for murein synthesis (MipA/OmpV family)
MTRKALAAAAVAIALVPSGWSVPAIAQEAASERSEEGAKEPRRVRVGVGAQFVPRYPGADEFSLRPLFDLSFTRGDKPFAFEAPDESIGLPLIKGGGFAIGPALNFEGSRKPKDVGAALDKVDFTFEAGAFVQYEVSESFRLRAEGRRGIGGHDAWTGQLAADFIARDADRYLFSIGPRATISDGRYHRAYFGVTPAESVRTGLATYRPDGGLQAVGAAASFLTQVGGGLGLYTYAKYDRLVEDAAISPVVRSFGSRDQFSGGLALTYTFGGKRDGR